MDVIYATRGVMDEIASKLGTAIGTAGNLDVLKLLDKLHPIELNFRKILVASAKYGNMNILEWCKETDNFPSEMHLRSREHYSNVWRKPQWWRVAIDVAAGAGRLEVLKWMKEEDYHLPLATMKAALLAGHLDVAKWTVESTGGLHMWTVTNFQEAAASGNIELLEWLKEQGCLWDSETYFYATRNGDLDVLNWLRHNGCPFDESTFREAVKARNLRSLEWFRINGCPWDASAWIVTDSEDWEENWVWLRDNGCPWDESVTTNAMTSCNISKCWWLVENGCPCKVDLRSYL